MNHKRFFSIFGSFPALSAAELFAVAGAGAVSRLLPSAAVHTELPRPLDGFGGLVKTGRILETASSFPEATAKCSSHGLVQQLLPKGEGKAFLGVSIYDSAQSAAALQAATQQLGRMLKKASIEFGKPARWVSSRERVLSSVVVAKNHLLDRGAEVVLLKDQGEWLIGKTTAVQDFTRYSERDYGRPARDAASGMLPPKLAQMLVNLSGAKRHMPLLDPFCGSGTVLMEALLLGFPTVFGSDKSAQAVQDTKANMAWLEKHKKLPHGVSWRAVQADIRQVDRAFPGQRFGAIVTEPYLGPQRRLTREILPRVLLELTELYHDAFQVFRRVLDASGSMTIIFPAFFLGGEPQFLPLDAVVDSTFAPSLPGIEQLVDTFPASVTARQSLLYHRPGQRVGREVFVFRRN